jgi:MATE family multidrug resistance protein
MTAAAGAPTAGGAAAGVRDVLRFAWPSVLSFVAASAFRVNDQFWVGGLGAEAQAALGTVTFVMVLNFAVFFVAIAGSIPLVARATGGADPLQRDHVVRQTLYLSTTIGLVLGVTGWLLAPQVARWLELEPVPAAHAVRYLRAIHVGLVALALAPTVDNIFIAMGDTRVPLYLQLFAVACNFILNPILIFGWVPGTPLDTSTTWLGIAGAGYATVISRGLAMLLGLLILGRAHGVRWARAERPSPREQGRILAIGMPSALSIAVYAAVYFLVFKWVFSGLANDTTVRAAFGVGFNAFEGVAFPFYLGVAVAGSSLIGRNLGAGAPELAQQAVRSVRRVGAAQGALFAVLFFTLAPLVAPRFTNDPAVAREAVLYVRILAASQLFVALETVNEKVLLGAGHTRPIFWISVPGNLLRVPLCGLLALTLGGGAAGIWWGINATTVLKAAAFHRMVDRGTWCSGAAARAAS